ATSHAPISAPSGGTPLSRSAPYIARERATSASSHGQFMAESSQRPSATLLHTSCSGTVAGEPGAASKYAPVVPASQASPRANGTISPSSYHTRALVAHWTQASQG